jgi:integrase
LPRPTAQIVEKARAGTAPLGRYRDAHGLMLVVGPRGASWILRYSAGGRRRDLGLGSVRLVSLSQARAEALKRHSEIKLTRVDPLGQQARTAAARRTTTFDEVREQYLEAHRAGWKDPTAETTWRNSLRDYAAPIIGKRAPADITTEDMLAILQPHWQRVPETMSRVRGRCEAILDFAKTKGLRDGENVARWKGHLALLLPAKGKVKHVKHHEAVPLDRLPAAFAKLYGNHQSLAAQAVAFCILTAARPSEAAEAAWSEIDLKSATWTLPPEKMKNARQHRVALNDAALAILKGMAKLRQRGDDRVFPARDGATPSLSTMVDELRAAAGGIGKPTTHGCRSSFDDFGHQDSRFASRLIDYSLSHYPKGSTQTAYRRADLLTERRALMQAWAEFLCGA